MNAWAMPDVGLLQISGKSLSVIRDANSFVALSFVSCGGSGSLQADYNWNLDRKFLEIYNSTLTKLK